MEAQRLTGSEAYDHFDHLRWSATDQHVTVGVIATMAIDAYEAIEKLGLGMANPVHVAFAVAIRNSVVLLEFFSAALAIGARSSKNRRFRRRARALHLSRLRGFAVTVTRCQCRVESLEHHLFDPCNDLIG